MYKQSSIFLFSRTLVSFSLGLILVGLVKTSLQAQNYVRDTLFVSNNDSIVLYAGNYEGDIQWQFSALRPDFNDDSMFRNLKNALEDTLLYVVTDSTAYFRAKVFVTGESDSCIWYSDIYKIQVPEAMPHLVSITPVDSIEVNYNTSRNAAMEALPATTTILDSDSLWHLVSLVWSFEDFSPVVADQYTARGAFELPGGVVKNDSIDSLSQYVTALVRVLEPQPPRVKTRYPSEVSSDYVVLGGEIISDGGSEILEKGVLWDSTFLMDKNSARMIITDTTPVFLDTLDGLQPDARYYVRAYAINEVDTAYGLKNIFDTRPPESTDSTFTVYFSNPYDWDEVYIHMMEENTKGSVDSAIWSPMNAINEDSIWYYVEVPWKYHWVVFSNGQPGTQTPVLEIDETAWYDGTQWHEQKPVDVGPFGKVTDIDGNQYETVVMGNQVWMAENLRTTHYNDSTPIDHIQENIAWANQTSGAYCWYDNDSVKYFRNGALYNWYTIDNTSRLCPDGWKLPDNKDWNLLFGYLDDGFSGISSEIQYFQTDTIGNKRYASGGFYSSSISAGSYWSTNESSSFNGYTAGISEFLDETYLNWLQEKPSGYNVRCLKSHDIAGNTFIPHIETLLSDSMITSQSALLQGEVLSDGGSEILEYGFYYDTMPDPQVQGVKLSSKDGISLGSFARKLTTLQPNTIYYYRAFARNKRDEATGYQHHFRTKWVADSIKALDTLHYFYGVTGSFVLDTLPDSVHLVGVSREVFQLPVVWNIEEEDTLEVGNNTFKGTIDFPDDSENPKNLFAQVTVSIKGLTEVEIDSIVPVDTVYHQYNSSLGNPLNLLPDSVRIFDTDNKQYDCIAQWVIQDTVINEYIDTLNVRGTIQLPMGNIWADNTQDSIINAVIVIEKIARDYDGNVYDVVKIGNQVWMAKNLKSTHYANGDTITGSYYYNNDTTLLNAYGRLYTWKAVMNGASSNNNNPSMIQGVCPDGWHVPGKAEWEELVDSLGGMTVAGGALKSTRTETPTHPYWRSPNTGATNQSGFSGLPAGRSISGWGISYSDLSSYSYWWSATQNSYRYAWYLKAAYNSESVAIQYDDPDYGMGVRCVED